MSRKGNCYDNAVVENFFGIFRSDFYIPNNLKAWNNLRSDIFLRLVSMEA